MKRFVPVLLAAVLLVGGFAELDQYGVNWDEALGDLFFGDRYASFYSTFDERYLDFPANPYPPGCVPDLSQSPFRDRPHEHWPVASTLAAATSRVVHGWLGVLDPFDGFHALNPVLGAILLIVFYQFLERHASTAVAMASTSLLFLMPRVVADLFANIKDFPEMVFFSLALMAFFVAFERGSAAGVAASGLLWGLAIGTKANAAFVPFVIIVFLLLRGLPAVWRERKAALVLSLAAAAILGFALFAASWPWLWEAPLDRLRMNFQYVLSRGRGVRAGSGSSWLAMVAFTTPLAVLVLCIAAIPGSARRVREREPLTLLLLSWIAVVAARLSLPGAVNFDVVRHFLELFPPLAALAGLAAVDWARRLTERPWLQAALVAVPVLSTAWATVAAHPFESVYWNAAVGGYSGARERRIPQASDYWATSYRLGIEWMNEHAPRNALLVVPIAGHTVSVVAPVRLRPDLRLLVPRRVSLEDALQWGPKLAPIAAKHPVYLMFVPREEWRTPLDVDAEKRLEPVARWSRDGAPVLLIYRL